MNHKNLISKEAADIIAEWIKLNCFFPPNGIENNFLAEFAPIETEPEKIKMRKIKDLPHRYAVKLDNSTNTDLVIKWFNEHYHSCHPPLKSGFLINYGGSDGYEKEAHNARAYEQFTPLEFLSYFETEPEIRTDMGQASYGIKEEKRFGMEFWRCSYRNPLENSRLFEEIMKTLSHIKDEVAKKYGFEKWNINKITYDLIKYSTLDQMIDEVAEEYTKEKMKL